MTPIRTLVIARGDVPLRLDESFGIDLLAEVRTDAGAPWPVPVPELVMVRDGDGLSCAAAIEAVRDGLGLGLPVLALCRHGDDAAAQAALEAGASDVVEQTPSPLLLGRRIANILAVGRQAQVETYYETWASGQVEKVRAALEAQEEELVDRLANVGECRDSDTGEHVQRVARYCWIIAEELGFDREQCRFLALAAQMHDIGKVGIPDMILRKNGRLTPDEFETMKRHTLIGQSMLKSSKSPLLRLAEIICVTHHERWDGSGYPFGLEGAAIPIAGRIAAVADVFDAVTSKRCYKPAWTTDEARQELVAGRGTLFDPACVDAMLARWDEVVSVIPVRDAA